MAGKGRPTGWRKYDWEKRELEQLYWGERKSCKVIAKAYGLSVTGIIKAMKRFDIPRRNQAEAVGRGADNAHWKGGKSYSGKGYIIIHKPEHHRASKSGYVMEHILVWEETHGTPLPKGWLVHHLNGIRSDNRPKNLLGMSKRGHSPALTMKEVQKRLRGVEAELAQQRLC